MLIIDPTSTFLSLSQPVGHSCGVVKVMSLFLDPGAASCCRLQGIYRIHHKAPQHLAARSALRFSGPFELHLIKTIRKIPVDNQNQIGLLGFEQVETSPICPLLSYRGKGCNK